VNDYVRTLLLALPRSPSLAFSSAAQHTDIMYHQHDEQDFPQRPTTVLAMKEPFTMLAIPAFTITDTGMQYGNAQSCPSFLLSSYPTSDQNFAPSHSLSTLLYPHQGLRGRRLWYGLAVRLAWPPTPQSTHIDNAVSRRNSARVREYAPRRCQALEKEVARGLG
jgi:hypothetical protein